MRAESLAINSVTPELCWCRSTPWGVPTGEVNGEDLPQTKDVDNGVRQGDPHASSKASLTRSSAECAEVKKIVSESCGKVNVAPAESVKENSSDVSSVPHETQEELQKPRVKLLRLPAEGEQEAAEIIGMAGGASGMLELPMEVANVA